MRPLSKKRSDCIHAIQRILDCYIHFFSDGFASNHLIHLYTMMSQLDLVNCSRFLRLYKRFLLFVRQRGLSNLCIVRISSSSTILINLLKVLCFYSQYHELFYTRVPYNVLYYRVSSASHPVDHIAIQTCCMTSQRHYKHVTSSFVL